MVDFGMIDMLDMFEMFFKPVKLPYEQGPIRPPSEANSLLLRVNRNCYWNKCEFCTVYKDQRFSQRPVDEVLKDIDGAEKFHREIENKDSYKTAFLQDGSALATKTEYLVQILNHLKEKFPLIERVTVYGSSQIITKRSQDELYDLANAGLSRVHVGLESGDPEILQYMNKGVTPEQHVDAGVKVRKAGISLCEYVLTGLGGKRWTEQHAIETANVLNQIDPDFIRFRRLVIEHNNLLYQKVQSGEFEQLTDDGIILEQKLLIQNLDGIQSTVASDHTYNPLMELEGKLPEDKGTLLGIIDRYVSMAEKEKKAFILGRRHPEVPRFTHLDHLKDNKQLFRKLKRMAKKIEKEYPGGFDQYIFDQLVRMAG